MSAKNEIKFIEYGFLRRNFIQLSGDMKRKKKAAKDVLSAIVYGLKNG